MYSDWCDDCGVCCCLVGWPPFSSQELNELNQDMRDELHELVKRALPQFADYIINWTRSRIKQYLHNTPCVWLNNDCRCSHYKDRPKVCREFVVGGKACLIFRKRFKKGNKYYVE